MSYEDTSYDADLVASRLADLAEEVSRLRLVLERGVSVVERLVTLSTAGTAS